jgi:hypothetical protein
MSKTGSRAHYHRWTFEEEVVLCAAYKIRQTVSFIHNNLLPDIPFNAIKVKYDICKKLHIEKAEEGFKASEQQTDAFNLVFKRKDYKQSAKPV